MDLTILGGSGSYPSATAACSGYLVRHDGYNVWMDAGNGTMVSLQQHIGYRDVDAILLSHVHPDHCADMYPYFFAILFAQLARAVPVLTPPGVRARLESLIGEESRQRWRALLDWREISPGTVTEVGPLRLEVYDAAHSAPNNTMRLSADGKVLCFSGDTGPNENLAVAARDADLFLCESSWTNEQKGIMEPIHLTASEAGEAARAAGADRLMLTHIWPENDRGVIREQAGAIFDGPMTFAVETGSVTV